MHKYVSALFEAGVVLAIALAVPLEAVAQYRVDQPAVLERATPLPVPDTAPQTAGAFRNAYTAAGKPRIALFWNIAFNDQLSDQTVTSTRTQGVENRTFSTLDKTTSGDAGAARLREGDDQRTVDKTVSTASRVTNRSVRSTNFSERDTFLLETAFTKTMQEGGVQFIDRAAIMRTTSAAAGGGGDARTIETKALLGKAELMLEILLTPDPEASAGWGFQGALKEIESGRMLGSFYSKGSPRVAALPAQYRATDKGFQRVTQQQTITIDVVGRTLALDAMAELTSVFTPVMKPRKH